VIAVIGKQVRDRPIGLIPKEQRSRSLAQLRRSGWRVVRESLILRLSSRVRGIGEGATGRLV
jgi:hypothetical protein